MATAAHSKLTIVVPVFNRATVVEQTLESIYHQTLRPLSIVIVDNNSTDGSREVIERWAQSRRSPSFDITVTDEPTQGAAAARNRGLGIARTPFVMFFDSDDLMDPLLTTSVVKAFESDSKPDIVGWDVSIELPDGQRRTMEFTADDRTMFNGLVHGMFSTLRYAARREIFVKAGCWNKSVRVWDDMELGVRLLMHNPKIVKLDIGHTLVTINYTCESITASTDRQAVCPKKEHALQCCEDTLRKHGQENAVKWVNYRRAILAAEYATAGAHSDAERLLSSIPNCKWIYRLLYMKHRIYTRGTHFIAPFSRKN